MAEQSPVEQIAEGLQRLINEAEARSDAKAREAADRAAEKAAAQAVARLEPRLDRQDAAIREIRDHVDLRLDRQDETLRLMWKQAKGNGKLPIDD